MTTAANALGLLINQRPAIAHTEKQSQWGKITEWLAEVFKLNPQGLNWPRGVMILDVLLVPLIVFWAIGNEQYLLSAVFAVLFAAIADPGGAYGYRASHLAGYGVIGAGLTALAFAIGGVGWGWLVLAAFAVTLVAGLAIKFGVHRFVGALLLNIWFVVALALAVSLHHHTHIISHTWAQVVAWVGGRRCGSRWRSSAGWSAGARTSPSPSRRSPVTPRPGSWPLP